MQGHGDFGGTPVSTPSMIRFGALTEDELFVTAAAAQKGVTIKNPSSTDPLVILKHFGPGNPDAAPLLKTKLGPSSWKQAVLSFVTCSYVCLDSNAFAVVRSHSFAGRT